MNKWKKNEKRKKKIPHTYLRTLRKFQCTWITLIMTTNYLAFCVCFVCWKLCMREYNIALFCHGLIYVQCTKCLFRLYDFICHSKMCKPTMKLKRERNTRERLSIISVFRFGFFWKHELDINTYAIHKQLYTITHDERTERAAAMCFWRWANEYRKL